MISRYVAGTAAWLLSLLLVAGCGGSGGDPTSPGPGEDPPTAIPQQTLVIQMDEDGDDEPDLLTLDVSQRPFRIVEALRGQTAGDPVDYSDLWRDREIDPQISDALADYLAGSIRVGQRTELNARDRLGQTHRIVVFE